MIKSKGKLAGLFIDEKGMLRDHNGAVSDPSNHRFLWFHAATTGLNGSRIEVFRAGTEKGDFVRRISKVEGKKKTVFWDLWRSGLSDERESYTKPPVPSASLMKKRVPQLKDPLTDGMFAPASRSSAEGSAHD